jgi:ribosomal-protein-alanine N-acetyltransferase
VEIALRDRKSEDFEALWGLDQECFPPGVSYSRAELAAYIRSSRSFTYVAEEARENPVSGKRPGVLTENRILGFIVAESSRRGIGHIITIDVSPRSRRFGVGSKLLVSAELRLNTEHCRAVRLETAVDNLPALTFYKQHGYDIVKTIPHYYSNGVDAFALEKAL